MNLILLGPPGSGKGTQAKFIEQKCHLKQLSTGELFRNAVREGSKLGLMVKKYIENGNLVPDEITLDIVEATIRKAKNARGFIFDGFPRTLIQARGLDNHGVPIHCVINFIIDFEKVLERLSQRRVCISCKKEYNTKYQPPKKVGFCDICGKELTKRKDDTPDIIKKRIEDYEKLTKELIDYYRGKNKLQDVDASLPIEEVSSRITTILGRPLLSDPK